MYLYEIPQESKIHIVTYEINGSKLIRPVTFHHTDGMYSYCTTDDGFVVNLSVHTPLVKVGDHYEIENVQKTS